MEFAILCIFTHFGRTYTFRNGEILSQNETVLQFTYSAMSDSLYKTATFPKNTIAGWSITNIEGGEND